MKRLVKVCVGSSVVALGLAIIPAATVAAQAAGSAGHFQSQRVSIPAPRTVTLRPGIHIATGKHPVIVPPFYANASAVASQRAASARIGGRRSGLIALAGSRAGVQAAASVDTSTTWVGFPGVSLASQFGFFGSDQDLQPPDTQVAAGPGAVAEATNDTLSVWSKTGILLSVQDLNSFFKVPSGFSFSDPRLLYDGQSGRWFLSGFSLNSSFVSKTYLAVSPSSSPLGTWSLYTVEDNSASATPLLTDQPMTGVCDDKVVIAWNQYTGPAGTVPTFTVAQDLVLQKSTLIAGSPLGTSDTDLLTATSNEFRLVPAQALSSTSTCWMTVNRGSTDLPGATSSPTLGVIAITGTPNGAGGVLSQTETDVPLVFGTASTPDPTTLPPPPRQVSAVTNDTALDDRFLSAVWQNGVLWTSGTDACAPAATSPLQDCMRIDEVNAASGSAPTLALDGDLETPGQDNYYPAVSLDSSGDVFVGFSASSPTLNPGVYAVIAPAGSGGAFGQTLTVAAGQASYNGGTAARWGDYSAAAPDPSQPGNVWVAGEYATADTAWGTAAGEVSLTAPPARRVAVAALSTTGVPYAQAPQLGTGWHSLGGTLSAVPAVAAPRVANAKPLFVGPGTNHLLYIRGVTGAWVRLGPNDISCLSVAAAITKTVLQLACETTDHGLAYNTATLPSSGLPQFTSKWKSLGGTGTIAAGPAVARVGGALTFFVLATDGKIHTRTTSTTFGPGIWTCKGQPAVSTEPLLGDTVFSCQGNNNLLYVSDNSGSGWGPTYKLSGTLAAGPAIATTGREAVVLLEGTNHNVYEGTPGSSYTKLGTLQVNGVEATALN